MLKHSPTHHDPRTQILIDLEQFIQDRIHKKEDIILSIDANETFNMDNTPPPSGHTPIHELFRTY